MDFFNWNHEQSWTNSTEITVKIDPAMHDMAFGIAVTILTCIILCILCTVYKIGVGDEERAIQLQLNLIKEQRIVAPPNTSNTFSMAMTKNGITAEEKI